MIRQPSTSRALLAWHSQNIGSRYNTDDDLHCGWYRVRMGKGSSYQPARVFCQSITDEFGELTEPEILHLEVDGAVQDVSARGVILEAITKEEYARLKELISKTPSMANGAAVDLTETPMAP